MERGETHDLTQAFAEFVKFGFTAVFANVGVRREDALAVRCCLRRTRCRGSGCKSAKRRRAGGRRC